MTETSESLDDLGTPPPSLPPGLALRAALERRGRTQKWLVEQLVARGIQLSEPTMTRIVKGERPLIECEFLAIREILGMPMTSRELPSPLQAANESVNAPEAAPRAPQTAPRKPGQPSVWSAVLGFVRRHTAGFAIAFATIFIISVVAATIFVYGQLSSTSSSSVTSPGSGGMIKPGQTQPVCDRYEVEHDKLSLRDEYSAPLGKKLPQGQMLTVKSTRNPHDLSLWEVDTTEGQRGWVDYRYLKPLC